MYSLIFCILLIYILITLLCGIYSFIDKKIYYVEFKKVLFELRGIKRRGVGEGGEWLIILMLKKNMSHNYRLIMKNRKHIYFVRILSFYICIKKYNIYTRYFF